MADQGENVTRADIDDNGRPASALAPRVVRVGVGQGPLDDFLGVEVNGQVDAGALNRWYGADHALLAAHALLEDIGAPAPLQDRRRSGAQVQPLTEELNARLAVCGLLGVDGLVLGQITQAVLKAGQRLGIGHVCRPMELRGADGAGVAEKVGGGGAVGVAASASLDDLHAGQLEAVLRELDGLDACQALADLGQYRVG